MYYYFNTVLLTPLSLSCIHTESDSLHEDRRSGRIQDPEHNEDTSKSTPPSNGTAHWILTNSCYNAWNKNSTVIL